ncbi:DUF1844 domain-containing protein [bacterium]|nr:DUF1844 domain-containing protein [bacterium]
MDNLSEFSSLILSLASSASYYMGENSPEVDLDIACHTINTIEMLQKKTLNNLTKEEETLLEDVLYRMRLKFIEVSKNKNCNCKI